MAVTMLTKLRCEKKMTQEEVADQIGIHPGDVCLMEDGRLIRVPRQWEMRLQKIFGKEWTFDRLMGEA
jgi:DNA-binding XRE family transcriptional regulator